MKKTKLPFRNSIAILALAIGIFSCSKKSEQVNYIPKDANVVLAFDVKSIGVKSLDFKELFSIENFKKRFSSVNGKDSTMEKLKNSGIDLLSTAYFFGQINEDAKGYGALTVALSDAAKFETFAGGLDKGFTIASEGDYKFAGKAEGKSIIGWNNSTAIFLFESTGSVSPKEKLLSFFQLKKEESLAETDKTFSELQKESGDISLWMSLEKISKLASQYSTSASAIDFKEAFITATCNFEKGQVVIDSKYHANKETAEKLSLTKESLSKNIANALPGKSVVAMLGVSLDMNKIYKYLEKEKLISSVDEGAQMTGLTSKELLEMLSGEFAGTINGMEMKEGKGPKPEFAFVAGISDKAKVALLLSKLAQLGLVKKDNYYSFNDEIFIVDKGTYLVITGTETMRQQAIDGKGEKLNSDLSDMLTENSGAFYMNMNNIPDSFLSMMGSKANAYVKNSQLESITITGSAIRDNVSKGKVVVAFKPKDENSLVTLARASEKLVEEEPEASVMPDMEELNSEPLEGAGFEGNDGMEE